ncbi:MAG TPA: hypothetical protein VFC05_03110 [Nitrososphaeraceae archaeon]|nr:hypothetical protein [Nitrososphaeraceae archaeon]
MGFGNLCNLQPVSSSVAVAEEEGETDKISNTKIIRISDEGINIL